MPKKKKGKPIAKILLVVMVIAVVTIGVVAWHDGLIGRTSMKDINDNLLSIGSPVTIKGEVVGRLGNWIEIHDGPNGVVFEWTGPSTLHSIVVVRGVVSSFISLTNVTSVDVVWIFN